MKINQYLLILLMLPFFNCASRKFKDVPYTKGISKTDSLKLNVFEPRQPSAEKLPVIIFVHGGNWNTGDKDTYGLIGRNFAKRDVVTVIPSYTLSPKANFDTMAKQIAEALQWTEAHIADYGGDPNQIYLMGHSAGGHLIALISTNPKYLETTKAIKGVILDDAAGLDMYSHLQQQPPKSENNYKTTWTEDPEQWKAASPIYFLSEAAPPFFIYVGTKTYQSIKIQNAAFLERLNKFQPKVSPIYLKKKHVPMVTQFFWPWSDRYEEILGFIGLK
ncbi:alpha/beta hydrolase [Subsaximicrobium wynnwilliamsii]|uniref:Alpha/beta hydrolase n=1 Tax=Subsaximicrobium wynnwilliamsii TaxID=291179 RepID=A0A5C6ZIK7_9FLAO|nr:alpha/beta hydrolase [Subsaximicrobium wynnwilliamsii]TXD83039.1 alpha/beta hydrolase [Subsaximicrobium wynnwilliamsii]TXD88783.1 alpha/beta hydrolase [Subsaximicrobium wynnwilliamsii]TXE02856.1 alpha/beta hydrolase [Subsaximicrobium wynnwilliamsii]